MNTLHWPVKLYIAVLVVAAFVAALGTLAQAQTPDLAHLIVVLLLAICMTIAWLFPLPFTFKTKLYLDTTVIVAALLLCEPGVAIGIAGVGALLAHILRRKSWDETAFNTAQVMLQAVAGSLLLAYAGWENAQPDFSHPEQMLAIGTAGLAMYGVNQLTVAMIIALQTRLSPLRVWWDALTHTDATEYLAQLAQVGLGVLAAVAVAASPWWLFLLVFPTAVVYIALERNIQLRQRVEESLRDSEASLAEAQRVARLGSWDWNLVTGEQFWSDEAFRLFGFTPQAFVPTFETFLSCVHRDDRALLDRAVHAALYEGQPFSLDYRICLPDGTERILHEQGELVFDSMGRKVRMVGTVHDITERKAMEAALTHQAFHDALTGLPNRALFVQRLNQVLTCPDRRRQRFAVLFLDLDRFKLINDTMGHEAGDQVLVEVARRLQASMRPGDTVARLGGDEFTVLLERLEDFREAEAIAVRLTEAFREPLHLGAKDITITTSIGVVLPSTHHSCASDILRDADIALYQAKNGGRARFTLFEPHMGALVQERVSLEADLRQAIERGELRVHYQPSVELATGRIAGMEALVRWQHPERGLIMPDDFIPLAEETGLIVPLGEWVLSEACQQMRRWHEQFPTDPPMIVSVNLSARQLAEPDVAQRIAEIVLKSGLDYCQVALEITEGTMIAQPDAAVNVLVGLRAKGMRIYMDDFGVGHSSLGALHRFPIDLIKIDRTFVSNLETDIVHGAIIRAIVTLADALDIAVVAEGVETMMQRAHLVAFGSMQAQGYLFSKPLDPTAAAPVVAAAQWQLAATPPSVIALQRSA